MDSGYKGNYWEIVWVDSKINNLENKNYIFLIQSIFESAKLETFSTIEDCVKYISNMGGKKTKVFLISSGGFGKSLMEAVHHSDNVYKAYVFCGNVNSHSNWVKNFNKIEKVCDHFDPMLDCIMKDIKAYQEKSETEEKVLKGKEVSTLLNPENIKNMFIYLISELTKSQDSLFIIQTEIDFFNFASDFISLLNPDLQRAEVPNLNKFMNDIKVNHNNLLNWLKNDQNNFLKMIINEIFPSKFNYEKIFSIRYVFRLSGGRDLSLLLEDPTLKNLFSTFDYNNILLNLNKENKDLIDDILKKNLNCENLYLALFFDKLNLYENLEGLFKNFQVKDKYSIEYGVYMELKGSLERYRKNFSQCMEYYLVSLNNYDSRKKLQMDLLEGLLVKIEEVFIINKEYEKNWDNFVEIFIRYETSFSLNEKLLQSLYRILRLIYENKGDKKMSKNYEAKIIA